MMELWAALPAFEKVLWGIALVASALFVLQVLMTFIGGDSDMDGDADMDVEGDAGAGHQMFTLKNLIAFFTLFAWTTLACLDQGLSPLVSIIIGSFAGIIMVVIMMYLFSRITALKHSGNLSLKNAIGLTARTYLAIPAARGGLGKVHVRVQGGTKELDALTDEADVIPTGAMVRVLEVIDERYLLVSTRPDK